MQDLQNGISLHTIPYYGDDHPEAKNGGKSGLISSSKDVRSGSHQSPRWYVPNTLSKRIVLEVQILFQKTKGCY